MRKNMRIQHRPSEGLHNAFKLPALNYVFMLVEVIGEDL